MSYYDQGRQIRRPDLVVVQEEYARCHEAKEAAVAEYEEAARQLAHLQHQLTNWRSQVQSSSRAMACGFLQLTWNHALNALQLNDRFL
jgi:hypothetical protein